MRKFIVFFIVLCISVLSLYGQSYIKYSSENTSIKYASFSEKNSAWINPEHFFSEFLHLNSNNQFVAIDSTYSPDCAYHYVKYMQFYNGLEVENSLITLTWHDDKIIRYSGNYAPIANLPMTINYTSENAIEVYRNHFKCLDTLSSYNVTTIITDDTATIPEKILCYRVQCSSPLYSNKQLYVSVKDLSIIKISSMCGDGFNGTLYTRYNGVRQANMMNIGTNMAGDTVYYLSDTATAVDILKMDSNVFNPDYCISTFYNASSTWGIDTTNSIYPNYMLDAYWSAVQYVNYMKNHFNCPRGFFQRNLINGVYSIANEYTPNIYCYQYPS